RRKHALHYNRALAELEGVLTPTEASYARHVYHVYAVRVRERDETRRLLEERGIGCGVHYPVPVHLQKACGNVSRRREAGRRISFVADVSRADRGADRLRCLLLGRSARRRGARLATISCKLSDQPGQAQQMGCRFLATIGRGKGSINRFKCACWIRSRIERGTE